MTHDPNHEGYRLHNQPRAADPTSQEDVVLPLPEIGPAVTLFAVGDKVYYAGDITRPGMQSELDAVDERIVGTMPASLDFAQAAALPLTSITAWEDLFDRFGLHAESTGSLLLIGGDGGDGGVGGVGGVGSMVIQLAKALAPGVRILASATRDERRDWVLGLGADDTVRQDRRDRRSGGSGRLGPEDQELSWHWEFMFTRSMFQTPDMIEQHHLLNRVATLVDAGTVQTTPTTTLDPINAENLRAAHALVESGRTLGEVVVAAEASVAG